MNIQKGSDSSESNLKILRNLTLVMTMNMISNESRDEFLPRWSLQKYFWQIEKHRERNLKSLALEFLTQTNKSSSRVNSQIKI